jgi:hypothetical protein
MRTFFQIPILSILLLTLAEVAGAQTVEWNPPGGQLGYGKTNRLSLIFDGCEPADSFNLPAIDGLDVSRPSRSEQTNIVNFNISQRVELSYAVQPTRRGEIVIPAMNINTNKGRMRVAEARFEIVEAKVGQTNLNIDDIVIGRIQIPAGSFWEGQVIDVTYLLIGKAGFNVNISSAPSWSPIGLLVEPFQEPEKVNATIAGEERPGLRYRTRALIRKTGVINLEAVQQRINVQTGERPGFFLSQPRVEEFLITSNQPAITVQPLPVPAPDGFNGAVGSFEFESTVVPTEAVVGDPITWTLKLSGRGNWPEGITLPEREAAVDFKVIQPQSNKQMEEDQLFAGTLTEDVVLVPTRPGSYRLGGADWVFFDPDAGRYETVSRDSVTVGVNPLAVPLPSVPPPDPAAADLLPGETILPEPPPVFENRGPALPRDPIAGEARGFVPFALPPLGWAVIVFLPAMIILGWQIWRRFRHDDPNQNAKKARRRLISLTASLEKATDSGQKRELLIEWMQFGARALAIPTAAPSVPDIEQHLSGPRQSAARSDWTSLWKEAEEALYGLDHDLSADWIARAKSIVQKVRVGRRPFSAFFRRRYWLPSILILTTLNPFDSLEAENSIDRYREGAFTESELGWRDDVVKAPLNSVARNNLALALAQQDRWPEANAYWTTAYVLNPVNEDLRWNLRAGLSRAPGMQPRLAELLEAEGLAWMATRLSPGAWDRIQGFGAVLTALSIGLGIFGLYRRIRIALFIAPIALIAGTAGLAIGAISAFQYGVRAHPDAVVVQTDSVLRSIPTDVADAQQSRTLPAGEIAVVEGEFLSWRKLRLDSGETGWARKTVILPVYRAPLAEGGSQERS